MLRSSFVGVALLLCSGCIITQGDDRDGDGGDGGTGNAGSGGDSGGETASGGSGGVGGAGGSGGSVDVAEVREWALEVALGAEFGGGDTVVRWSRPPTLSVIEGTSVGRALIDELAPKLSASMGTNGIEVVADGDETADIDVYFIPLADFDAVGDANGFPIVPNNWGYFYMYWDNQNALTETYVLIATDKLSGDSLRHFTFEETTQALGLATDSSIFDDSIFFANGNDGGSATDLSSLDARLLKLLYTHASPGDDVTAFGQAFDDHFFD